MTFGRPEALFRANALRRLAGRINGLAQTEIVRRRYATSVLIITGLGKKAVDFFVRLGRKFLKDQQEICNGLSKRKMLHWYVICELYMGQEIKNTKEVMTMAQKTKEPEKSRAVAPWRPFMGVGRWETEMDRMMEDFFGRNRRPWWPSLWSRGGLSEFTTPVVDIYEEKDDIVVKAELPGMTKDEIEVDISNSHLTLRGEKKKEEKIEEEGYFSCERS